MPQPTPEVQVKFLTNLQRLLSEGAFVATYKYALLMAIADICVEKGHDEDSSLEIESRKIAEKFVHYYWRQCAPYLPEEGNAEGAVLRQNTGRRAAVIRLLMETWNRFGGSLAEAQKDRIQWNRLVAEVDQIVRIMPLWRLQTIGTEQFDFLYENVRRGRRINLNPGVSFCFRRYYSLISDLVKGAWLQYVRRFNPHLLGRHSDLHEFLFGSERTNLSAVEPILREFQKGTCFYCDKQLRASNTHVDHFIPWSRYPVDLGHNLVLAHETCNARKSDRIAAARHLKTWIETVGARADEMSREFYRRQIINDWERTARIADWAYTQTFETNGLTWVQGKEMERLPAHWRSLLTNVPPFGQQ